MPSVASPVDISRALPIGGWMSERELLWLATQARNHPYIVEFGSLYGRSARAMADNLPKEGRIWCVDPWAGDLYTQDGYPAISTYCMPNFIENMRDHIDAGRCHPIREFSYRFSLPHKVDMVFIDGDHDYKTVVKDIKKALELLELGGLICGHDYSEHSWPGVKQAVDEWIGEVSLEGTIWSAIKL